jgi:hypothetical protein
MFVNASQVTAGTAATGAYAVLFGSSIPAVGGAVVDDRTSSFVACTQATSVDISAQNFAAGFSRFNGVWQLKGPIAPPPGGGAGRPGAPGAPAGGGGSRGGGPKRHVTVDDVLVALNQLKMKWPRISLLSEELAFLMEERLVERMSDEDYDRHERSILSIDLLERDMNGARDERLSLIKSRNKLLLLNHSRWHRFWTGRKKLDEEAAELKWSAKRLEEISSDMRRIDEDLRRLDITKEYLDTFVRTSYGYMRLSRKAELLLEEIKIRNGE